MSYVMLYPPGAKENMDDAHVRAEFFGFSTAGQSQQEIGRALQSTKPPPREMKYEDFVLG
jgi:hypothetical protein